MRKIFTLLALLIILAISTAASSYIFLDGGSAHGNGSTNASPNVSIVISPSPTACIPSPTPQATEPTPSPSYGLYDNFNSDSGGWTKRSNTWSSDFTLTTFMPSYVYYQDGKLVLNSFVGNHTGSEYKSNGLYSYGKYRASIKLTQTPGTYETFFSYRWQTDTVVHNEIDIEIQNLDNASTATFTTWVNGAKTMHVYYLPFDPCEDYHIYGYDWYPDRVEFYIDNMSKPIWTSRSHIPNELMYVYFNNWVVRNPQNSYGDGVNAEYVDWVTVELT